MINKPSFWKSHHNCQCKTRINSEAEMSTTALWGLAFLPWFSIERKLGWYFSYSKLCSSRKRMCPETYQLRRLGPNYLQRTYWVALQISLEAQFDVSPHLISRTDNQMEQGGELAFAYDISYVGQVPCSMAMKEICRTLSVSSLQRPVSKILFHAKNINWNIIASVKGLLLGLGAQHWSPER